MPENPVTIAPLLHCRNVITLGVRAGLGDYTPREREILLSADRVFFPTPRFAGILEAAGKETFPSAFTYRARKSRLIQEVLFQFLKCPHPRTRIYYGRQKDEILCDFRLPLIAMGPRTSDGAVVVSTQSGLEEISRLYNPLIIKDIVEYEERFRLIFINYRCAGIVQPAPAAAGESVAAVRDAHGIVGGEIRSKLEKLVRSVKLNDIAVEIGTCSDGWQVIEIVRPPLSWPSSDGVVTKQRYISRLVGRGAF